MIQDRTCQQCTAAFRGGPRAFFCPVCREARKKKATATYRQRKRSGKTRPLGSTDRCERCGGDYTVEGGNQQFCPECQPIHAAEYDRETALPYYHANSYRINPSRKIKRRKRDNRCAICGKEFEPVNGSKTCSAECKAEVNRRRNRAWYARQKENSPSAD